MAHLHSKQWARERGALCVHYGSDSLESEPEDDLLEQVQSCSFVCTLSQALVRLMHSLPVGHVAVIALCAVLAPMCLVQDQSTT